MVRANQFACSSEDRGTSQNAAMNSASQTLISRDSLGGFVRSCIKKVRPSPRGDLRRFVRSVANRNRSRTILNYAYTSLAFPQKQYWHSEYSRLFRGVTAVNSPGTWRIFFEGKKLLLPVG